MNTHDMYSVGQLFGEAYIAICVANNLNIDEALDKIKDNPSEFYSGLYDSQCCHRGQKKIHIHMDVDVKEP